MTQTLERAIAIAATAHAGQVDKGGAPYILHPLKVMLRMTTLEERIVAVLHDVVEDCAISLDDLRKEGFSEDVLNAIESVTKVSGESYEDFVERAEQNPIGRVVKLADLEENSDLSRIASPSWEDLERVEKYRRAIGRLR
ncbi:GTP pyrophosphokinase [Pseudomonas koreensis]|uniref:HD domain-containing protein n=1 Tax=Pseudomonas koreensis TaxID=198620 RepID=UPI0009857436|nr:HD domain-containing protein [Pseudomonas koreensis]OOH80397.1 GTP pyrophosphokinase [Pseudomonas koreensis]